MKATRRFLPSAISPLSERGAVGEQLALADLLAGLDRRGFWWISVPWLERMNFCSSYSSRPPSSVAMTIRVASTKSTVPALRGQQHVARVERRAALHAGADQRRVGLEQRHRLALHVRAHQRAVGVVVLEERDHRRRHRPDLLRRDVDQVDLAPARRRRTGPPACGRGCCRPCSLPFSSTGSLACAIRRSCSSVASRWTISSVSLPSLTTRYGRRDEAVLGDLRVGATASRSGRCSGPPASRSGTSGRNGSGARRAPRSARAHA